MARNNLAVVIGASLAGLLAATALRQAYRKVIVLDRDALPVVPRARREVPQAHHPNILPSRGIGALDTLMPGFAGEMVAAGGLPVDKQNDLRWYLDGRRLASSLVPSGVDGIAISRPLLEHLVRRRAATGNVSIMDRLTAVSLITDGDVVTGVVTAPADTGETRAEPGSIDGADLVVDATGFGSRAPAWLRAIGIQDIEVERVDIDQTHVSRRFRRRQHFLGGQLGGVYAPHPGHPFGGVVTAEERDVVNVSLNGSLGAVPGSGAADMEKRAIDLPDQGAHEILRQAHPVGDAHVLKVPYSVRRYYERLPGFPAGFAVLGDALCTFNPIYGQGITVAALEAVLLRNLAAAGTQGQFQRRAASLVDVPWRWSADLDRAMCGGDGPGVTTYDGLVTRLSAATDPAAARAFLRVVNLLDHPDRLDDRGIAARAHPEKVSSLAF
ncbi:NAD(P)/FAD-dependent oxidoreductase [Actinoplanes solisilvae]|uniref:NAD(P)/FAD-dependent oxidoreductase n=1 Tax=Actinoplanes solisilvae TaxID=2486853 RepID=UPI000FDAC0F7|nr:hypothetical protein [Actinoplanes solisilvae]